MIALEHTALALPAIGNKPKGRKPGNKLSLKALHFCKAYIQTKNARQAAVQAGYSQRSAHAIASRLLTKDAIQTELARLIELNGISQSFVLEGVRSIAIASDAKYQDQLRAYELLGKYLKLWTDKVELDVSDLADRVAKARMQANQQIHEVLNSAENGAVDQASVLRDNPMPVLTGNVTNE